MMLTKKLLNQRGSVAIVLVLSAVAIVTPFVVNFSFDTEINKLKVYNIEDRAKAKLTAQSGLQFAMARLRLYKEAYNFLQKNKEAAKVVRPEILDTLWNFPFVYPIPVTKKMNAVQKEAIKDFSENNVLDGEMRLTIENISNKINLNLLRLSAINDEIERAQTLKPGEQPEEPSEEDLEFQPDNQLIQILSTALDNQFLTDESFEALYSGIQPEVLLNEMKYYISDPNAVADTAGGDQNFRSDNFVAKRAPFASFTEVYTLPEWPDDIVNLVKNEFTVHGAIMIDLNRVTDKLLRVLIPNINDEDIKEFYLYKDDPEAPKHFNTLDDFKNYFVNVANLMGPDEFDQRFQKYEAAGLKFGPSPTLFKAISTAKVGRAEYIITAYIVIPAQPKRRLPQRPADGEPPPEPPSGDPPPEPPSGDPPPEPPTGNPEEEQKTLLLEPRIVEIIIG